MNDHAGAIAPESKCEGGGAAPRGRDAAATDQRKYLLEKVDDAGIVQLYADGFERLPSKRQDPLLAPLQAAIAGRDIFIQQKCAQGLEIRDLLEEIVTHPRASIRRRSPRSGAT